VQRNRLLLLAAALGIAAVVAVLLIVVGSSGKSDATPTTTAQSTSPTNSSLFAGIQQHGDTLGAPGAPVTLTVFEDPQCPFCRDWDVETLPTVVDRYIRGGRVKLVYRGIEIIGPNSLAGLRAIYAAGRQNKLWPMVNELYKLQGAENSGWITASVVRDAAAAVGADGAAILAASNSADVTAELVTAAKEATADSVNGTPTFILQKPASAAQHLSVSGLDAASFTSALDAALQ
jgi:protein-disulfide isomerase